MNNAEKFQKVFGYYATEMWAKTEAEFLDWINEEHNERTGEWIKSNEHKYECPFCHVDFGNFGLKPNYCPNCGAKMGGDTE